MSLVFVGTYTDTGSEGIYAYRLDEATGALSGLSITPSENPSYLAIHPNGRYLYAANELAEGTVTAYAVDSPSGRLSQLNQASTHGHSPCYLCVDPTGHHLLVTNYFGGNVVVLPIQADGSLGAATAVVQHQGVGPNPERQEAPHPHSVEIDPSERLAWVQDLGLDRLVPYRLADGVLVATPAGVQMPPGAGPRHMAWHPAKRFAYVINELNSTITAFAYHQEHGTLTALQTVPTLPAGGHNGNTGADIHLHPSGRFLYGSNRGHDSIVQYRVDPQSGLVTYVRHEPTQGRTPRNFAIDPTGRFLLVANQESDSLVSFRIDGETGRLSPTGHLSTVPRPVCIKFLG
ncbi:MAG: lactonase family protein [Mycobacterium leprae]